MKTKPAIKVPVHLVDGVDKGILHDTDYARGAGSREEAAAINAEQDAKLGHHRWGAEYVMETVEPFTVALRLVQTYHRKSSAYVEFEDPEGKFYPVFLTDLVDIIGDGDMAGGWIGPATYVAYKRGARSYGIRKVKKSE